MVLLLFFSPALVEMLFFLVPLYLIVVELCVVVCLVFLLYVLDQLL